MKAYSGNKPLDVTGYAPLASENNSCYDFNNIPGFNSNLINDAEVKILEYTCDPLFNILGSPSINVEIFSDKKTCSNCLKLIDYINSGNSETGNKILVDTPDFIDGRFKPLQGIYLPSEKIPYKDKDSKFYLNIR